MSYTFDCFYQKWEDACADAVKIGEVSGNAPYDKGYTCQPVTGTEDYSLQIGPDVASTPPVYPGAIAQVHHVVPMKDKRCCPWGTSSYKNAAVISAQLNRYLTNNAPPVKEVMTLNTAEAYTP